MSITVNTNVASLNAQRNLARNNVALSKTFESLSSGLRINRSSDDAAGLAISSRLTADTRSLKQAQRNSNDAISMIQVAEGALGSMSDLLNRMRELAVQSANGTLGATERGYLNDEVTALKAEVDRISAVTEFNGVTLLDGDAGGAGVANVTFQIGIQNSANDRITIAFADSDTTALGINATAVDTVANAQAALDEIDTAIDTLNSLRASFGVNQNRVETTIQNLATTHENLSAANSRIMDADIAEETAALTKNNILTQAGTSVLTQANNIPQLALQLLNGG